jgi:RpiR family carbohydrate utilization transcriptional regulator
MCQTGISRFGKCTAQVGQGPGGSSLVQWLRDNAAEVTRLSITEVAMRVGVSEATIVRAAKALGYEGYPQIKIALALGMATGPGKIHEAVSPDDSDDAVIHKVFASNRGALDETLTGFRVADALSAANWISVARRVEFYGIGASGLVATDASQRFVKLGIDAHAETDGHAQAIRAVLLGPEDVVVAISHSGRSRDILDAVGLAKERGARIVTVTQAGDSPLSKIADAKLMTVAQETAWREEAMASRIAQLSILDALFVIVGRRLGTQALMSMERTRSATKNKRLPQ